MQPSQHPRGRGDHREARQEVIAELPRLVLRDLIRQQTSQAIRFHIRRAHHQPTT